MCTVSHLNKKYSDLLVQSITGTADNDCKAYSNTVEIFFAQQTYYKQLSLNVMTTLLWYSTIVDIWTKVQDPALHNKLGPWAVL